MTRCLQVLRGVYQLVCWFLVSLMGGYFIFQVPSKSPFAAPLERMQRLMPLMEEEVAASEEVLTDLLDKLSDMVSEKKLAC